MEINRNLLFISDECHHLGSEVFSKSMQKVASKYMLGLSATPNRKDGLRKVFEWFIGPIVYMTKDKNNLEEIYICDVKAIKNLYNKNYFNKESINGDGTSLIGFNFKELEKVSIENNYIFYKYPVKQLSLFNGQG